MMEQFIYVFSTAERDILIGAGYHLLKSDDYSHVYIFENRDKLHFDVNNVQAVLSNTLTF